LATLPLAPLTDAAASCLSETLARMDARLLAEASTEERKDLWTGTFVLLGLRYPRESVAQLFRGIAAMKESDTYQAILEEGLERGLEQGALQGALRVLFVVGTPRLGEPDATIRQRLEAADSVEQVGEWVRQISSAESWSDLSGI
jgi:predicted transposase YdaD